MSFTTRQIDACVVTLTGILLVHIRAITAVLSNNLLGNSGVASNE